MIKRKHQSWEQGQALVTLLIFIVLAITLTSGAVTIIIANSLTTTKYEQSTRAYYVAEGGMENGILRLLRDPTYVGETLSISDGTATITVTGTNPYTVTSQGKVGNLIRTVQATVAYNSSGLQVTSWSEQ